MQCHIEMTADLVKLWADLHPEDIATEAPSIQTCEQLLDDLDGRVAQIQEIADTLYDNWVSRITGI